MTHRPRAVRTGLDQLLADEDRLGDLRSARLGVLAHPASVTRDFTHVSDALIARDVTPARLFGPEHGLRGEAQDMVAVDEDRDPLTGLPVVSLYGHTLESLTPRPEHLEGLDLLLIDLQDVGSRYYTYVYTAMLAAEAATRAGIRSLVLDRPNPIGGAFEGRAVSPGFESFVGMLPLPHRHGLTLGEVLHFAQGCGREIDCEVIPVQGWHRDLSIGETDAPWVLPSPNMPTPDTALVYPGLCLLEGTNLSEGRGTTRPFEIFGAPWVDPHDLKTELESLDLPGVRFRPLGFQPMFQKWAPERCRGLQLHVTDPVAFRPLRTGTAIVWACARLFDGFDWRREAYEFVDTIPAIDLLFGTDETRRRIERGDSFRQVLETVVDEECGASAPVEEYRLAAYGNAG